MADWVTSFVETIGYPGIFVLMIIEIFVPVVQSEIVMTFSGFTASRGRLSLGGAIVAGVAGSQVGSVALYWIARQVTEERLNEVLTKYGGWLGFSHDNLERAEAFFRRHDRWAVLIGRLLPGIRAFIAVPAGIEKMAFWRFFLLNLLGTAFWVTVLTILGSVLGDNYDAVDQYSSYITYGLLGALGLYVLYRLGVVARDRVAAD